MQKHMGLRLDFRFPDLSPDRAERILTTLRRRFTVGMSLKDFEQALGAPMRMPISVSSRTWLMNRNTKMRTMSPIR